MERKAGATETGCMPVDACALLNIKIIDHCGVTITFKPGTELTL